MSNLDKWARHELKGGYDHRKRNQRCVCGIIREHHQIDYQDKLACPKVPGRHFTVETVFPPLPLVVGAGNRCKVVTIDSAGKETVYLDIVSSADGKLKHHLFIDWRTWTEEG